MTNYENPLAEMC